MRKVLSCLVAVMVLFLQTQPVKGALFQKNTSNTMTFFMADSTDKETAETGLTVTCSISGDEGSWSTCTNSPATEVGNGWYKIVLTNAELNYDRVRFWVTATGAVPYREQIYLDTYTRADLETLVDDVESLVSTVDTVVDAIKLVTDNLPDSGALSTIQSDLDNPSQYKANISGLNDPSLADITSSVAAQITSDHGSGSYVAAGAGSGAFQVDIDVVLTGTTTGIPNYNVLIYNSDNTTEIARDITNVNGRATLQLDGSTTYYVRLYKNLYTITTPQTLYFTADTTTTYESTQITFSAGTPPKCTVTGIAYDGSGNLLEDAVVVAELSTNDGMLVGYSGIIVQQKVESDPSDANGEWSIALFPNSLITPSGTTWTFTVYDSTGNYAARFPLKTVPNQAQEEIDDLS